MSMYLQLILAINLGFSPTTPISDVERSRQFAIEQYCNRPIAHTVVTERSIQLLEEFTGRTRENHSFENGLCYIVDQHYMWFHHVSFIAPPLESFNDPFAE